MGSLQVDTFKIELALAGFSKLPTLSLALHFTLPLSFICSRQGEDFCDIARRQRYLQTFSPLLKGKVEALLSSPQWALCRGEDVAAAGESVLSPRGAQEQWK